MIVNIEHVPIIQVQLMKQIVEVGYHIVHQIMLLHNVLVQELVKVHNWVCIICKHVQIGWDIVQ